MLFNLKWNKPQQPSLEGLIAWLEQQPGDKTYCYTRSDTCLLAQYLTSLGYRDVIVGRNHFNHASGRSCVSESMWAAARPYGHDDDFSRTKKEIIPFHVALTRAKKALAKQELSHVV